MQSGQSVVCYGCEVGQEKSQSEVEFGERPDGGADSGPEKN